MSVAICTRDRPDDLRSCIAALRELAAPPDEIIVVDNAPSDQRTSELCRDLPVRYEREDRRGLNWARTRAAETARGDILAFVDDDARPDRNWLNALLKPFADPSVSAVTGLVMPLELETRAQAQFEVLCGFSRGFERRDFDSNVISPLGAANVGAGASMAFRRCLINGLRLFEVELDAGTAAHAGGDTYAFYRLLSLGHRIVYEPGALVWHRHRRSRAELHRVLYGYSLATSVYFLRCLLMHGEASAIVGGLLWFKDHHLRHLRLALRGRKVQSRTLTFKEISAVCASPVALARVLWQERKWHRIPVGIHD